MKLLRKIVTWVSILLAQHSARKSPEFWLEVVWICSDLANVAALRIYLGCTFAGPVVFVNGRLSWLQIYPQHPKPNLRPSVGPNSRSKTRNKFGTSNQILYSSLTNAESDLLLDLEHLRLWDTCSVCNTLYTTWKLREVFQYRLQSPNTHPVASDFSTWSPTQCSNFGFSTKCNSSSTQPLVISFECA